ncbi:MULTISPECIES: HD domain-containing phosphohydrolase [unclassified Agarivorans]|uniref:HD domain-containing phosphohydrolase n=1 Tax=unclassified Agarivorans TaxID=2636026 RepID=UPI003D7C5B2F
MSRLTLYLAISTLCVAAVMSLSSLFLLNQHKQTVMQLSSDISKQASVMAATLEYYEAENRRELEYFASLDVVQRALNDADYSLLQELLMKLMNSKASIVQARLLDPQGKEVFKIINRGGQAVRLSELELQDKSKRYYVRELLQLPVNRTYLSAVDLNVDYGVLELPYRPVLRIAKQVSADSYPLLGALMFNYDMKTVYQQLSRILPRGVSLFVVAQNHQFLVHPLAKALYCAELSCQQLFNDSDLVQSQQGLSYFSDSLAAVAPLGLGSEPLMSGTNLIMAYKPSYLPQFTQRLSPMKVLIRSYQWWLTLWLSLALVSCGVYVYWRFQKQIDERIQRAKMHKVLQGVTEMLERLHESDDPVTGSHVQRVADYSRLMAERLGLAKPLVEDIHLFASLHDIGKISIPDAILGKPGKLDPLEWEIMQQHVVNGYQLLCDFRLSPVAENIVHCHHERWDGTGYPLQIVGEDIPIEARIVSLVDCFDALMSARPYKPAYSFEKSQAIINQLSGKAFDPSLVQLFNTLETEFRCSRSSTQDALYAKGEPHLST